MRIIRAGEHIQHIPGYGISVREGGVAVAESNWWEVAGKTCVAAYQPKGAASYAASKVNLANPGTYDATDGAAYPTWAAAAGWTFAAASRQYLETGLQPSSTWTVLVQVVGISTSGVLFGRRGNDGSTSPRWYIANMAPYVNYNWGGGAPTYGAVNVIPTLTSGSGNLGMAGRQPYRNGVAEGENTATWTSVTDPVNIPLGAFRRPTGVVDNFTSGSFVAVGIWSETLSAAEVATVVAAMAAL